MVYDFDDIGPGDLEPYKPPGIKKNINEDDLATVPFSYRQENRRRLVDNSPDMQNTSKLCFIEANKLHKKYPNQIDTLGYDTKRAPKVNKLPQIGYKGQVVEYNNKLYIAGGEINGIKGKFKSSQRTIGDYSKGKS